MTHSSQPYFPPPPTSPLSSHTSKGSGKANGKAKSLSAPRFPTLSDDPASRGLQAQRRLVDAARRGLALAGVAAAVCALGLSGRALRIYDSTHVPSAAHLPLWPDGLDAGPTVAAVACSALMVVCGAAALLASQFTRHHGRTHGAIALAAPLVSLVLALAATGVFYAADASPAAYTLQSWACRWSRVPMDRAPHFGTMCRQIQAGVYLVVIAVPIQLAALGVAGWQAVLERKLRATERSFKVLGPGGIELERV